MAFLATEDRFGPDLNRHRRGEPDPCTYTPKLPDGEHLSGTFGYRSEQHPQSHFVTAASSPAIAATLKSLDKNSLKHLRETSVPNVCTYSPTVKGQFPRAYTMKEILAERKRTAVQHNLVKNEDVMTPQELHVALGPGSYDANQHEKIATPFTFSHEKRHGILENTATLGRISCSPGPVYRIESTSVVSSASTVANTPFQSKHASAFITRVRSGSQLHQQQKKDAALYSKELAKSYQQLGASVERLGKRLASPELREQTFRRFDKEFTGLESYRRGPGSYNSGGKSHQSENVKSADWYELSPLRATGRKPNSSFGRVASRDLLTSMIAAGHASASTIGPGIYDAYSSSFVVPTHNIGYKQQNNPKPRKRASSSGAEATAPLTQREMWKVMRQGPSLPS